MLSVPLEHHSAVRWGSPDYLARWSVAYWLSLSTSFLGERLMPFFGGFVGYPKSVFVVYYGPVSLIL